MELIGREAELEDGHWYTLQFDKGWDETKAAGIDLGMLALRKDEFVLALFKCDALWGQVCIIGLKMPISEIAKVRARLPEDAEVGDDTPKHLEFCDPYQIVWQISLLESEFRTSGHSANRWLQL